LKENSLAVILRDRVLQPIFSLIFLNLDIVYFFLTDMYIKDVQTKTTSTTGTPEIVKETVATALVNGNNILGKT